MNLEKDVFYLAGFDFGSTTSSAVLAQSYCSQNYVTGKQTFTHPEILFCAPPQFTPFDDFHLDIKKLLELVDTWISQFPIKALDIHSAGAIITGLAAEKTNASILLNHLKQRIPHLLVATASDPRLESWIAFKGNCHQLSLNHPKEYFLNVDIGGGTTNIALGKAGEVLATGSIFIGARHVVWNTNIPTISSHLSSILTDLNENIHEDWISDLFVSTLKQWIQQKPLPDNWSRLIQSSFYFPEIPKTPILCFSGGVGELLYQLHSNKHFSDPRPYQDLGLSLAKALLKDPFFNQHLSLVPPTKGRSTVFGIALHNTQLSGNTTYLAPQVPLPLEGVALIKTLHFSTLEEDCRNLPQITPPFAIRIEGNVPSGLELKYIAQKLRDTLFKNLETPHKPILIILEQNIGKTLGSYLTNWNQEQIPLVIIDEMPPSTAEFISLGKLHQGVIPVSYYGFQ